MQIQYLKQAPKGNAGDIAEVTSVEARALIALGIAKAYTTGTKPKSRSRSKKETTKSDTDSE